MHFLNLFFSYFHGTVSLKKLTVTDLIKKLFDFYAIRNIVAVLI